MKIPKNHIPKSIERILQKDSEKCIDMSRDEVLIKALEKGKHTYNGLINIATRYRSVGDYNNAEYFFNEAEAQFNVNKLYRTELFMSKVHDDYINKK